MNLIRNTMISAALVASVTVTQAAQKSFQLTGTIDSGALTGQTYSGGFSFDDALVTGVGTEWLDVSDLVVNFAGSTWTLANQEAPTQVAYIDGSIAGLSYSASNSTVAFSFIPGTLDASDAFLAYDTTLGNSGAGNVQMTAVPEASHWALALAGISVIGLMRRRAS